MKDLRYIGQDAVLGPHWQLRLTQGGLFDLRLRALPGLNGRNFTGVSLVEVRAKLAKAGRSVEDYDLDRLPDAFQALGLLAVRLQLALFARVAADSARRPSDAGRRAALDRAAARVLELLEDASSCESPGQYAILEA